MSLHYLSFKDYQLLIKKCNRMTFKVTWKNMTKELYLLLFTCNSGRCLSEIFTINEIRSILLFITDWIRNQTKSMSVTLPRKYSKHYMTRSEVRMRNGISCINRLIKDESVDINFFSLIVPYVLN
jgi:hypothetical protein